jgi:hypothetical protein
MLHAAPDVRLEPWVVPLTAPLPTQQLAAQYRHDGAAQLHSIRTCEFKSFVTTVFAGVKSALTAGVVTGICARTTRRLAMVLRERARRTK